MPDIYANAEGWVYLRLTRRNGAPSGVVVAVDLGALPGGATINDEQLARRAARQIREALRDLSDSIPIRGDGEPLRLAVVLGDATGAAAAPGAAE